MTSFIKSVNNELVRIREMIGFLMSDEVRPVKSAVAVKHVRRQAYYYKVQRSGGSEKRTYLGSADSTRLNALIKSSYKHELLAMLRKNEVLLRKFLASFLLYDNEHVMKRLSPCLRDIPFSYPVSAGMQKQQEWTAKPYDKNPKAFPANVFYASDGTRVRSKSECIIYNLLLAAGIPFRYDPLLEFTDYLSDDHVTVYKAPDFQILCPNGHFILIEHAGLLASGPYALDLAKKLQIYQLNGYILGYSLFVTSDIGTGGIDSRQISAMINVIRAEFPEL